MKSKMSLAEEDGTFARGSRGDIEAGKCRSLTSCELDAEESLTSWVLREANDLLGTCGISYRSLTAASVVMSFS